MQLYKDMYFPVSVPAPAPAAQHQHQHPGLRRVYNEVNRLHTYNAGNLAVRPATTPDRNIVSVEHEYREWVSKGREPEQQNALLYWSVSDNAKCCIASR